MIYKLTSSKKVIAKVFADLNLREGEYRITDMLEWVGEALLKIGAISSLIPKTTGRSGLPMLRLENYQAKLPCDFHSLNSVSLSSEYGSQLYPLKYAVGNHAASPDVTPATDASNVSTAIPEVQVIRTAEILYGWTYEEALFELNSNPDLKTTIYDMLLKKRTSRISDYTQYHDDHSFVIVDGYIKTNTREGYLMLSYNAIPTDDEGYVMIPDMESFMEAIYWYINMKLSYSEWRLGQIPNAVYQHCEAKWRFYSRQAYGEAMMPDMSVMPSLINQWNKLIPNFNEHHSNYENLGTQEIVYNVNAHR